MNKEEKIGVLKALWRYKDCGYSEYEIRESLEFAIEELLQEPCEDAISREELKKWLDMNFSFGGASRKIELFDRLDKELSPVTLTRKKGKWIEERDDYGNITGWHCSNCYDKTGFVTTCAWDYCPNCGAEMESEE